MKPRLLIAESQEFSPVALGLLEEAFEVAQADLDRAGLLDRVSECEVLWVRLRNQIDEAVLKHAPQLKLIATNTTGLNHIDLEGAQARGIPVVSLRGEVEFLKTIRATAELTIGLALALLRKIPAAHQQVLAGGWDRSPFKGHELYEKTVGVIGYGRLGSIVAGYFRAFGCRVLATDPRFQVEPHPVGSTVCTLDQLLSESDLITLHVNLTPENRSLLGASEFARVRPGALFINTARGELVDETALLDALRSGRLGGVALDVVADELGQAEGLRQLRELARQGFPIVLTPHLGGHTVESSTRTEIFLAQRVVDWFRSGRLR